MKPVSVLIVVKNNPQHLFETLASVDGFAYEIIIGAIDIGNIYKKKLLENKKVTIVELKSDVQFADLVKEDLKKFAKGEYILYLDPDEIFPSISNQQLITLLQKYDYFYFPRKNIIFGKWIRHSRWWPDHQLRLFKKNTVVWPKELHPVPKAKGQGYTFPNEEQYALLHYNYDSIDQYMEKAARYAKSEALSYVQKKQSYSFVLATQKAISEFISRFFGGDGYKDGIHGFTLAILQMFYYFLVYFYFWEYKKYVDVDKNLPQEFQNFTQSLHFETNFWMNKKGLVSSIEKIKLKLKNIVLKLLQ